MTASERIRDARKRLESTGKHTTHVQEVIDLYFWDPFLSDQWYGKMIEDAQARDDVEADNAN